MSDMISKNIITDNTTFRACAEKYVDDKRNVLSPASIRDYSKMCNRLPQWFVDMKIGSIEQRHLNQLVNELAADKKPKTVSNMHGFVSSILGVFRPDLNISTHLPQKVKNKPYIPTDDDIKKMLEKVKGTRFEIPFILGCYGMRRSEICALQVEDIEGDIVHITKALVQTETEEFVIKPIPKTTESTRDIIIPMSVADKIREQGYVYNGFPGDISKRMSALEKELGIPHFTLHKLRHYFASKLSSMNIPEADILGMGGWETDYVMKNVYRHSMLEKETEKKREISSKLGANFLE
jgi:integrase